MSMAWKKKEDGKHQAAIYVLDSNSRGRDESLPAEGRRRSSAPDKDGPDAELHAV